MSKLYHSLQEIQESPQIVPDFKHFSMKPWVHYNIVIIPTQQNTDVVNTHHLMYI